MNNNESFLLTTTRLKPRIADRIEELVLSGGWFYMPDCAYKVGDPALEGKELNPYFSRGLLSENGEVSQDYPQFPWYNFDRAAGFEGLRKYRAHVTFHWPRVNFGIPHNSHVDQPIPHYVALYYVNDTDGDTFFYDDDGNVDCRITPEKGKLITFDGTKKYHASSSPSSKIRMTLNVNYENL